MAALESDILTTEFFAQFSKSKLNTIYLLVFDEILDQKRKVE